MYTIQSLWTMARENLDVTTVILANRRHRILVIEMNRTGAGPVGPLADRMAVEAAMAFIDVVRQGELDRLQVCGADDCGDVLVDLSKNRSRRYCSTTCANRVNVAAFRARHAGQR